MFTCRKSAKWLESKDFEFELIDIVKEPPLINYLNLTLNLYSGDKKRILIPDEKPLNRLILIFTLCQEKKIIQLLLSDGKLIKRPFWFTNKKKSF